MQTEIRLAAVQYGDSEDDGPFARVTFTVANTMFDDFDLVCEVKKRTTIDGYVAAARNGVRQLNHDLYSEVSDWAAPAEQRPTGS